MNTDGITFLGDVFLPKPYKAQLPWLGQYVFNLESPITQATVGHPGKINLKVDKNYSKETFGHPPVAVSLANNHILDYEQKGLDETLQSLRGDEIRYFGAGDIAENCNNPTFITSAGCRIALLGYVCSSTSPVFAQAGKSGVAPINVASIAQDIIIAKERGAERVVVSMHWGAEQVALPKPDDVLLAHAVIDAGADLLIGHHAHCVQPWELYKGKYIFYGLGNCILPDIEVPGFFQGETPTRMHAVRNKFWNKRSLAVEYFPVDGSVKIRKLVFDGETVKSTNEIRNIQGKSFNTGDCYKERFHRAFVMGKMRWALFNYLANPRLPSLHHLRILVSMAFNKVYK